MQERTPKNSRGNDMSTVNHVSVPNECFHASVPLQRFRLRDRIEYGLVAANPRRVRCSAQSRSQKSACLFVIAGGDPPRTAWQVLDGLLTNTRVGLVVESVSGDVDVELHQEEFSGKPVRCTSIEPTHPWINIFILVSSTTTLRTTASIFCWGFALRTALSVVELAEAASTASTTALSDRMPPFKCAEDWSA